ncbi:MAG: type II toxin-antitoxin system VapC family toxin [Ruminococcus sp.]|jgi:predicted nucleic acid-binding protein|nr:type II toxin-antitoxin system VapC family toxin [Ruminococcus sp.]
MKILLDNNIILDVFLPNKLFAEESKKVYERASEPDNVGYVCSNSLTDIYYFLKKSHSSKTAKKYIVRLIELFTIIPLTAEDCSVALALEMDDFEDAIIAVCANKAGVDYIISRDKDFLSSQNIIETITPSEFLKFF